MEAIITLIGGIFKIVFNLLSHTTYAFFKLFSYIYRKKSIYGTSHWLKGKAKKRLASTRKDGLLLDGNSLRLSLDDSNKNLILAASPGQGKSTRFVIPNVLAAEGSIIVPDPAKEIFGNCAGYLQSKGYSIKVIDVENLGQSCQYNPLERATTIGQIMDVAAILIEAANPEVTGENQYFVDGATQLLQLLIRAVKDDEPHFANLHNVYHLLNNMVGDYGTVSAYMAQHLDERGLQSWTALVTMEERAFNSILSTARVALRMFEDPIYQQLCNVNTIDIASLRREKTALFIQIPEHLIPSFSFFLKLLFSEILDFLNTMPIPGESYQHVTILLEEAGNIGKIRNFANHCAVLRKKQVSIAIILQSMSQLKRLYGDNDANTILDSCSSWLVYPGSNYETSKMISEILGDTTVDHWDYWEDRYKEMRKPLKTVDQIRTLDDDEAIFIFANKPPLLIRTKPYFRNSRLVKLTQIPIPELGVEADLGLRVVDLVSYQQGQSGFDFGA